MKIRLLVTTALVAFAPLAAAPLPAIAQERPAAGFADLIEKLSPAVVNISTTQKVKAAQGRVGVPFPGMPDSPEFEPFRDFFERYGDPRMQGGQTPEREVFSLGSGFIIDASGYIITNNHVVAEADEISVILPDKSKYSAKIVGRDAKTDLALLKVDAKKDLPFVPLGDSDAMRVGDWVIAIGNPFGLGGSVTQGIISARARSINAGPFDDFLQTDAPINKGNSGGPLFNLKGEVIGINSAIFSPTGGSVGIGFAIPSALAKPVITQLKEHGRTQRGWLGVQIQEVSDEIADSLGLPKAMGALVLDVAKDSPAAKAGLVSGDVITSFDGKEISQMRSLPRLVAESKIGKSVSVTYIRKGATKTAQITLGELDESTDASDKPGKKKPGKPDTKNDNSENVLGLHVMPLSPQLRAQLRADDKLSGLVVVDIAAGSSASKRGLREGDVINEVNGDAVTSVPEFKKAIESAKKAGRKFVLVRLTRNGEDAFVTLPITEDKNKE